MPEIAMQIDSTVQGVLVQEKVYSSEIGQFEQLPKWLNCIPLIIQWLFLSLRYKSITLPSAANPGITSGGMVGEGKLEYFNNMGPLARSLTGDFIWLVANGATSLDHALASMQSAGLDFPVVAKPNLGWCGYGVCKLANHKELEDYLHRFPIGETLILQRFISDDGEAGIFYVRNPGEEMGHLVGILLRYYPRVVGDGRSTVTELMEKDLRLKRLQTSALHKPDYNPSYIPFSGEIIRLATIGSTRVGGLYSDGTDLITPELTARMNEIARDMGEFNVGRFDMRYKNIDELRRGIGLTIMEVNGAGSEAVQAWDPKYSIFQAYKIIFAKQRLLFKVGAAARKRGRKAIGIKDLASLHFHQQKLIRNYPPSN